MFRAFGACDQGLGPASLLFGLVFSFWYLCPGFGAGIYNFRGLIMRLVPACGVWGLHHYSLGLYLAFGACVWGFGACIYMF